MRLLTPRSPDRRAISRGRTASNAQGEKSTMLTVVIVAALGWAAYKFFRFNTGVGTEAVRAYYFLEALLAKHSPTDANRHAHFSLSTNSTESIQRVMDEVRTTHDGKQLPLIAEAYRRGMMPMLPAWYRSIVLKAPVTNAIQRIYRSQHSHENLSQEPVATQ